MSDIAPKLSESQVEAELKAVPDWSAVGDTIQRTFQFKDFTASMHFVDAIAAEAERVQHHPDILIRYSRVTLTLSTHDSGGITSKDFSLARTADALARPMLVPAAAKPAKKKTK